MPLVMLIFFLLLSFSTSFVSGYIRIKSLFPTTIRKVLPLLSSNSGDIRYLQNEFNNLSQQTGSLKFKTFYDWDEIQALVEDQLFEKNEFNQFWIDIVGDVKKPCNFDQFVEINRLIDNEIEDEENYDEEENEQGVIIEEEILSSGSESIDESSNDQDESDVWNTSFDPIKYMDPEFILYLRNFFNKYSTNDILSFSALSEWSDVKELLQEGNIDVDILKDLWLEALQETGSPINDKKYVFQKATINFDTFLRINIRLNEVIEEVENAIESLSDEDLVSYYKSEFQNLISDNNIKDNMLTIKQVLNWNDLKQVMIDFNVEEDIIVSIWNSLKSHISNTNTDETKKEKGFGAISKSQLYNEMKPINEDEFVNFNYLLEAYLKQKVPAAPTDWDPVTE